MNKKNEENIDDDTEIIKVMEDFSKELDKIIDETVDEILENNKKEK